MKDFKTFINEASIPQENLEKNNVYFSDDFYTNSNVDAFARKEGHDPAVGIFGLSSVHEAFLYELTDFDERLVRSVPLKNGEMIFRYGTTQTIISKQMPLIKVNVLRGLVYYLTEESSSGVTDEIKFESRGEKVKYLRLKNELKPLFNVF